MLGALDAARVETKGRSERPDLDKRDGPDGAPSGGGEEVSCNYRDPCAARPHIRVSGRVSCRGPNFFSTSAHPSLHVAIVAPRHDVGIGKDLRKPASYNEGHSENSIGRQWLSVICIRQRDSYIV